MQDLAVTRGDIPRFRAAGELYRSRLTMVRSVLSTRSMGNSKLGPLGRKEIWAIVPHTLEDESTSNNLLKDATDFV